MDRYKFDLRVYVLVVSCDPLRLFLYNDGLVYIIIECYTANYSFHDCQVRLSTEQYAMPTHTNLVSIVMHDDVITMM